MAGGQLNQIIAVMNGKKKHAAEVLTLAQQMLVKRDLLAGLTRTYRPKTEDGETMPDERKNPQLSVPSILHEVRVALSDLFDVVSTQDHANTKANADVVVDGELILSKVPVTHLLFLDHQLEELENLVSKLPVLDPAENWEWDSNSNFYRSEPSQTNRTKKVAKVLVKYAHTPEHPAQTELISEDIVAGTYTGYKFSGCIPAETQTNMLTRVRKLQEAVKMAREKANQMEVQQIKESDAVFNYILGNGKGESHTKRA